MTDEFHVVDENVLIVANQRKATVSGACSMASIDFLEHSARVSSLVIDDEYSILLKYASHCNYAGAPGVGDWYFVWAQNNAARLRHVSLEVTETGDYRSFPNHADLEGFDIDDRIYVATVALSGSDTSLVNAADSDYSHVSAALRDCGIRVMELCASELKAPTRKRARWP